MLQAILQDGTLVTPANYSREEIEGLRRKKNFYCPTCRSELVLKAGKKVIPHFAHKQADSCPGSYGEGPEHELGKLLIYQWLLKENFSPHLEKYISSLKQIPDLFLSLKRRSLAIEYQRARLSRDEFLHRTRGYQNKSIIPLWILGENQFVRLSTHSLKLSPFLKGFLHRFSSKCKSSLYFFCPHTRQFSFFQDLYFPENNRALGSFTFTPLARTSFRELFHYRSLSRSELLGLWLGEKLSFRRRFWGRAFGRQKNWLEWLYARGLHWQELPSIVYLPVRHEIFMASEPWDWQSRLVLDLVNPLEVGGSFSLGDCFRLLRGHSLGEGAFPLFQLSRHPVLEYMDLLGELGLIRAKSENHFIKLQSIEFNKNIEDAIMNDKLLINKLKSSHTSNIY